tara:strand:+ start:35 stop:733 length:699 start_codon:yes stop_codon:yes gene_type:complete
MLSNQNKFRQMKIKNNKGNTFIGLIIGLIIGLLFAFFIALGIMNTPLPFIDKVGNQTLMAGELGDPNKNLPGGAREDRDLNNDDLDFNLEYEEESLIQSESFSLENLNKDSDTENLNFDLNLNIKNIDDSKKLNDLNKKNNFNTTNTSNSPELDRFIYFLQAGAFREMNDAEAMKARLALMSLSAIIAEHNTEMGTLFRVRVGPFLEEVKMNVARENLSSNGVDAAVVRVPK